MRLVTHTVNSSEIVFSGLIMEASILHDTNISCGRVKSGLDGEYPRSPRPGVAYMQALWDTSPLVVRPACPERDR